MGGDVRREHLDGDALADHRLDRRVDRSHAALADLAQAAVLAALHPLGQIAGAGSVAVPPIDRRIVGALVLGQRLPPPATRDDDTRQGQQRREAARRLAATERAAAAATATAAAARIRAAVLPCRAAGARGATRSPAAVPGAPRAAARAAAVGPAGVGERRARRGGVRRLAGTEGAATVRRQVLVRLAARVEAVAIDDVALAVVSRHLV